MLTTRMAGRTILKDFEALEIKPAVLENRIASKIVKLITDWATENRKKFGKNEFSYISKEVVKMFPCEKEVCITVSI